MIERLTVGQYQDIMSIPDDMNTHDQNIVFVSIVENKTVQEVKKMRYDDFMAIVKRFDKKEIDKSLRKLEKRINHDIRLPSGRYYLNTDQNKMTSAQLMQLMEVHNSHVGNQIQGMHEVIACLCSERVFDFHFVPATIPHARIYKYQYDEYAVERKAQEIKNHVKVVEVWSAFVFFWNLWNVYERYTQHCLREGQMKASQLIHEILASGSGGSQSSRQ